VETLVFLGLKPDMTVIEVWPGGGWYTEVLAPVLREQGQLVTASFPDDAESEFQARAARAFRDKLAAEPDVYDRVRVVPFAPPSHQSLGEAESADMVLLSRHFHNLIASGQVDHLVGAAYDVLRPRGVLAVIQHRDLPDAVPEGEQRTGYVTEAYVIERVTAAGFEFDASSEVNANPRDTRQHPAGVWTLPPTLQHCRSLDDEAEREACESHYRSIGESDRMTLRFVKPT
jgi:predicted methyltransferase